MGQEGLDFHQWCRRIVHWDLPSDLLYYRFALGQPDPDAFLAMLARVGAKPEDARSLAIDLAAISRFQKLADAAPSAGGPTHPDDELGCVA